VRRAPLFRDRREAGRRLAGQVTEYAGRFGVVVVALPRGGVPVGFEVARALGVPLDVFVVRKVGFPGREELAIGAVASGGVRVVNDEIVREYGVPRDAVTAAVDRAVEEVAAREAELRGDGPPQPLAGRTAIVVDDGLATGMTMRAALTALRERGVAELVVAVPVAPAPTCRELVGLADLVVCGRTPEPFEAVGAWYVDFEQVETAEVRRLLAEARPGADAT
jgi:predicted phosphoribosyltransferase